ncbi:hypothetical protein SAV14893_081290 [Streptomyces avermitilis]|uniref:Uncharacterized protein n=1 Tax=Streptomyces avermitilis TaxID=33903 RepID=A0A4D4MA06_STRAX|nr:hypothetical protein SAV14893_081290 [Streptomyces avermitilis]
MRDQLELRLSALNAVRAEQERRKVEQEKRQAEEEARQRAERDKAAIAAFASTLQRTLVPRHFPRYRAWSWPAITRPPPRRKWAVTSTTSSPWAGAGGHSSWAMCAARAPKPPRSPH